MGCMLLLLLLPTENKYVVLVCRIAEMRCVPGLVGVCGRMRGRTCVTFDHLQSCLRPLVSTIIVHKDKLYMQLPNVCVLQVAELHGSLSRAGIEPSACNIIHSMGRAALCNMQSCWAQDSVSSPVRSDAPVCLCSITVERLPVFFKQVCVPRMPRCASTLANVPRCKHVTDPHQSVAVFCPVACGHARAACCTVVFPPDTHLHTSGFSW